MNIIFCGKNKTIFSGFGVFFTKKESGLKKLGCAWAFENNKL
jgi:hypothetical protein